MENEEEKWKDDIQVSGDMLFSYLYFCITNYSTDMTKQIIILLFLMILSVVGAQLDGSSAGLACSVSCVCSQMAAWARRAKMVSITCRDLAADGWKTGSAGMLGELGFSLLSM